MSKNSSAKFYQKTKEKKVHQRYPSLSKEEKEKKQESSCGQYKCLPKDEKQKLTQYKKIYYKMRRNMIIIRNYFHLENFFSSL